MEFLKKNKTTIMLLVLLVGGFLLYKFAWQPQDPLLTSETNSTAALIGQDLISELNQLRSLSQIDDTLFVNPAFLNLKDVEVPIEEKPVGRPNPFLPAGS